MQQATSAERATGPPSNPVDYTGLCLLSLDGGGVRGLSTLHILKSLMTQLNHERQKTGAPALKPCELFDLIGGTSTGGLITIMLGRLEMDVDECIAAYTRLTKAVLEERAHRIPFSWSGQVQSRFDSNKLKAVIDDVITRQGYSPTEPFNNEKPRGCKVFVCTAAKDLYGITRLRSYDLPQKPNVPATISEAALATSAATGFFDSVSIGARQFVDGALGVNNPVEEVEGEAADIWCAESGNVKPLVKCFISIGTGNPGKKAVEDNLLKFLSQTLVQITTETEETAKRFVGRWRQHLDQNRYFRLNVEQGLQDIGLAEYKEQGRIEAATHQYLDDHQISRVRHCVANLKQKQSVKDGEFLGIHHSAYSKPVKSYGPSLLLYPPPTEQALRGPGGGKRAPPATIRIRWRPQSLACGIGWCGKTQVASRIAFWTKENKLDYSVFWVSAMSGASFEQAYTEISKKLFVRKSSEDEDLRESVRRSLESDESGKWLLVVDNADDMDVMFGSSENPDGIFQYLPETDYGRILFTTRFRRVAAAVGGEMVELVEMSPPEAERLLEKWIFRKDLLRDKEGVADLLCELTYLPLAITQAAAYINTTGVPIRKYVELIGKTDQDVVGLMSREFHDSTRPRGSRHTVATTWLVSFHQIRQSDPAAADLLTFLSCIDPKAVPQSILPLFPSEEAMVFAIGTLDAYAFVVRRGNTDTFDMHSLVLLATRIWVRGEGVAGRVEESAVQHVTSVFPSSDYSQRDRWREYLPHALRLLQRDDTVDLGERYDLCMKVGQCLQVDGRIKEAVRHLQECYNWRREHLDEDHPDRLASQHELAQVYRANGQVKEALRLLEEVVRIEAQTLAKDHPDRLASQHGLARAYEANGQINEAMQLLEEVVRINAQTLAEDHLDRLASQHELAGVYEANGQINEAIRLLEEVVQIHGQTLAEDHPDRLASQHELAGVYLANEQVNEAVQLLEEVVRIKAQTLTEDRPSRLASQHELARAYKANGQVKEAVRLLEEVVRIRGQTLAEDHPDQLASQHELVGAYRANGQVNEAVRLLEEVVRICGQTLAEDHPSRLASQHNLAIVFWDRGQHATALEMMRHVVKIHRRVLDKDHPDRIASEEWLELFKDGTTDT
ncbi:uncharacterized protein Z518_03537 [Rhinocladiella mackenziei CBS 650.93]|uniref:PNPLA domain-containing protein n=1 Tax=Rhinocladiella mackenziei CBS 650.93 TaxID=1442369 RepID=A0A0D2JHR8_9EURO|nr:uncharacterized protein Z518_03537 [Rhinocladiella mackenziei CBS 650.93]KIX08880.1 hypothetical protein Z518_03537 [Rhinocladiella mackenziei CBS 650.93]